MRKYIIRYKFGINRRWSYSFGIIGGDTHSGYSRDDKSVITITLTEARKYVKKIVKIRKKNTGGKVTEIQILNAETDEVMNNEEKPTSRFELMDI